MSDWEEYCEKNGWNTSSADDYDKFLQSLEHGTDENYSSGGIDAALLHFDTYEEAVNWAKANPGQAIKRSANGRGFETQSFSPKSHRLSFHNDRRHRELPDKNHPAWDYYYRWEMIGKLSSQLNDVITKSDMSPSRFYIYPLDPKKWNKELRSLTQDQLLELKMLVQVDIEDSKRVIRDIEAELKRNRKMRYEFREPDLALLERMEEAAEDIEILLTEK